MSWTPVDEHALLSDCGASALVTKAGSVDWLCLPRFDSAPVFGRLLRRGSRRLYADVRRDGVVR